MALFSIIYSLISDDNLNCTLSLIKRCTSNYQQHHYSAFLLKIIKPILINFIYLIVDKTCNAKLEVLLRVLFTLH